MPELLTELNNKLDQALGDFKALNTRHEELAAQGEQVTELKAAVDKANAEVTKLLSRIGDAEKAAQDRSDDLEAAINRLGHSPKPGGSNTAVHAANFFTVKTGKLVEPKDADVDAYAAFCHAFVNYLKVGKDSLPTEVANALRVGSDPDGGLWVPDEMDSRIRTRMHRTSPLREIAQVMTIGGEALEFLVDTDLASSGGWVGEMGSRPGTDTAKVKKARIVANEQYANPKVTQMLLDDAVIDVPAYLEGKTGDILGRTENNAFVVGDGNEKPKGFLQNPTDTANEDDSPRLAFGTIQHVVTGASGAFAKLPSPADAADDSGPLIDVQQALHGGYRANASWAMNRTTFAAIRKLRDNDGNYLWERNHREGPPMLLLGSGVVEMEDMPVIAADSLSIAYADWAEAYLIVDRMGIRVLRDPYTAKPFVLFYTTKRTGGALQNTDAIKILKFAA